MIILGDKEPDERELKQRSLVKRVADARLPAAMLEVCGPYQIGGQDDAGKIIHLRMHSHCPVNVNGLDSADSDDELIDRTEAAVKDLAEMLFGVIHQELDPHFMVTACPALKEWINRRIKEGEPLS